MEDIKEIIALLHSVWDKVPDKSFGEVVTMLGNLVQKHSCRMSNDDLLLAVQIFHEGKKMSCRKCKKECNELRECDCAEYFDLCKECWEQVPADHKDDWCFLYWFDYDDR